MRLSRKTALSAVLLLAIVPACFSAEADPEHEGKPLSAWIGLLQGEDEVARQEAARTIAAIGPAAARALHDATTGAEGDVFEQVVDALSQTGEQAVPLLLATVRVYNEDRHLRWAQYLSQMETIGRLSPGCGGEALARIGGAALPAVNDALKDEDRACRLAALTVHRIVADGDPLDEAAVLVTVLRNDEDDEVRATAAFELVLLSRPYPRNVSRKLDQDVVFPALNDALKDKSGMVQIAAAVSLAMLEAPDVRACVPVLIEGLKSQDSDLRWCAATGLRKLGPLATPAIPDLCEALGEQRAELADTVPTYLARSALRITAASALARIGDPAIPSLMVALRNPDLSVQEHAISALGEMGKPVPAAVPALIDELSSKDSDVRMAAASALATVGQNNADAVIPALIAAVSDKDEYVRSRAASSLGLFGASAKAAVPVLIGRLGGKDDGDFIEDFIEALGMIGPAAEAAIPALEARLPEKPMYAAEAIGKIGKAGVPALLRALSSEDHGIRGHAILPLRFAGAEAAPAIPMLMKALRDPDRHIRGSAIRALEAIGPASATAVPELASLLADTDPYVRYETAIALARLGPAATGAIPDLLKARDAGDRKLRLEALRALARIGDKPVAISALIEQIRGSSSSDYWDEAVSSLASIGADAREAEAELTKIMADAEAGRRARIACAGALTRISPDLKAPVRYLEEALDDNEYHARLTAAAALVRSGIAPAKAVDLLKSGLRDTSPDTALRCAAALTRAPAEREAALQRLITSLRDPDAGVRQAAAENLSDPELAEPQVVSALAAALRDQDENVGERAAVALGELGPEARRVIPALHEAARVHAVFADDAIEAIQRIERAPEAKPGK